MNELISHSNENDFKDSIAKILIRYIFLFGNLIIITQKLSVLCLYQFYVGWSPEIFFEKAREWRQSILKGSVLVCGDNFHFKKWVTWPYRGHYVPQSMYNFHSKKWDVSSRPCRGGFKFQIYVGWLPNFFFKKTCEWGQNMLKMLVLICENSLQSKKREVTWPYRDHQVLDLNFESWSTTWSLHINFRIIICNFLQISKTLELDYDFEYSR